jgi:hypothetical protein
MPTATTSSFINTHLKNCLSDRQFRKVKHIWLRDVADGTHLVEIQDRPGVLAGTAIFTVNLGVFIAPVFGMVWGKAIPRNVKDTDCVLTERIGGLMADGLDKWWEIGPMIDVARLAEEVSAAMIASSDQFFAKVKDLSALRAYMISRGDETNSYKLRGIYLAAVELLVGNVERSKTMVESLKMDTTWGTRARRLEQFFPLA